eukprot:PhM_4_TR19042/c2_g1_i1/m.79025
MSTSSSRDESSPLAVEASKPLEPMQHAFAAFSSTSLPFTAHAVEYPQSTANNVVDGDNDNNNSTSKDSDFIAAAMSAVDRDDDDILCHIAPTVARGFVDDDMYFSAPRAVNLDDDDDGGEHSNNIDDNDAAAPLGGPPLSEHMLKMLSNALLAAADTNGSVVTTDDAAAAEATPTVKDAASSAETSPTPTDAARATTQSTKLNPFASEFKLPAKSKVLQQPQPAAAAVPTMHNVPYDEAEDISSAYIATTTRRLLRTAYHGRAYALDDAVFRTLNFLHDNGLLSVTSPVPVQPFWEHFPLDRLRSHAHVISRMCDEKKVCWCHTTLEKKDKEWSRALHKQAVVTLLEGKNIDRAVIESLLRASSPNISEITPQDVRDFISFTIAMTYYMGRLFTARHEIHEITQQAAATMHSDAARVYVEAETSMVRERLVCLRECVYALREAKGFSKVLLPMCAVCEAYLPIIQQRLHALRPSEPALFRSVRGKVAMTRSFPRLVAIFLSLQPREPMQDTIQTVYNSIHRTVHVTPVLMMVQDALTALACFRGSDFSAKLGRDVGAKDSQSGQQKERVIGHLLQRHQRRDVSGRTTTVKQMNDANNSVPGPAGANNPVAATAPAATTAIAPNPGKRSGGAGAANSAVGHIDFASIRRWGLPTQRAAVDPYFLSIYYALLLQDPDRDLVARTVSALIQLCEKRDDSALCDLRILHEVRMLGGVVQKLETTILAMLGEGIIGEHVVASDIVNYLRHEHEVYIKDWNKNKK